MIRKCQHCHGKGGSQASLIGSFWTYWRPCLYCKGRGKLYAGQRAKQPRPRK